MYIKKINNGSWYDGTYYYKDSNHTILHREDGPAIEFANKTKHWYLNGKYHRENAPAVECSNGTKFWYMSGKLHRIDGPAVETTHGQKEWRINGKLHREDGPAIIHNDGSKSYYLNHKWFSKNSYIEYIKSNSLCSVKKARILRRCT